MTDWLTAIHSLADSREDAVLVTVISVQGSSPREAGAKMLVSRHRQFDTIGGGHLEMRACEIAREMLGAPLDHATPGRRVERFSLGPSLGQCCGGVVHLAFERIDETAHSFYACLAERWRRREDSWRVVPLDSAGMPALVGPDATPVVGGMPASLPAFDRQRACHVAIDENGRTWLIDPCLAWRPHLVLFGAGHVGAAIVRALANLPCHVTWVDERDAMFPDTVPSNVRIEATDTPEAVVDDVTAGSSYLVMTHSHALDQRLAEAILRREDAGWFGLIGSTTKRMQFEHRLRNRGIAPEKLAHMVCPVGVPGIGGKAPAVIAASVAAQLLQVWEAEEREQEAAHIRDSLRKQSTTKQESTS
ncbi:MAG TPA: xanthine dehydrogenase accessory protein XdhC [Noviherbaspirillum sp.]